MKNVIKFLLLFVFSLSLGTISSQNECIATNTTDWTFAIDLDGNPGTWNPGTFTGQPIEVPTGCLDPAIISCICPGQSAPNVSTCDEALEIWAEDFQCIDNVPCSYPPNRIFYFQRTFDFSDSCFVIDSFLMNVQADNFMDVRINGISVLNTFGGGCPTPVPGNVWSVAFSTNTLACFNTNVANALNMNGPNTITVMVQNAGGGCLNYAFLSLCAKFWTSEAILDASFDIDPTPASGGDLLSSVFVNGPDLYHEWYFMNGPSAQGPWNPIGAILGSFNFTNFFAQTCVDYRVIHRVALSDQSDCEACFEVFYRKCLKGEGEDGTDSALASVAEIDCAILDEYVWPIIGAQEARGSSKRGNNISADSEIQIYPVPVSDILKINWNNLKVTKLQVLDINGKFILGETIGKSTGNHQILLEKILSGTYVLQLETSSGEIITNKFVIAR